MNQPLPFHDVLFPTDIAFKSQRSVSRPTEIVALGSGHEHRNQRWQHSKRHYDAGFGIKTLKDIQTIVAFFEARRGAQSAFRFRDPLDWKSAAPDQAVSPVDQILGQGDGQKQTFNIVKNYGDGSQAYARPISVVVVASLVVAKNGQNLSEGTHFTVDYQAGTVTFANDHVPEPESILTCGFEFDVPVRFADEDLTVNLAAFDAGDIPSVPLVEVVL